MVNDRLPVHRQLVAVDRREDPAADRLARRAAPRRLPERRCLSQYSVIVPFRRLRRTDARRTMIAIGSPTAANPISFAAAPRGVPVGIGVPISRWRIRSTEGVRGWTWDAHWIQSGRG